MTKEDEAFASAVIDQLNAELAVTGMPITELARLIGRPYDSTRNYLKKERALSLGLFIEIAAALKINPEVIIARARQRMP